jgi:hypothetical protein
MKQTMLKISTLTAIAAVAVLAFCLFASGPPASFQTRSLETGGGRSGGRIEQLERQVRQLSTRLGESERRLADWEESWDAGEAPEYYRRRLTSPGTYPGSRRRLVGASRTGKSRAAGQAGPGQAAEVKGKPARARPVTPPKPIASGKGGQPEGKTRSEKGQKAGSGERSYVGGLLGLYYQGRKYEKLKLVMTDYEINFDFAGGSPDRIITEDHFSIRWVGAIKIDSEAGYGFHTLSDDGVRLWVDGRPIIDNWGDHSATLNSGKIHLKKGYHSLRLDFYENGGVATMKLYWSSDRFPMEIIPSACLYHDPDLEEKARKKVQ